MIIENRMEYRRLDQSEIAIMAQQGCSAEAWENIAVCNQFDANRVKNVRFSGHIKIGSLSGVKQFSCGIIRDCTISNVTLHNCEIGDNVYINDVKNHIANYRIGNNVLIENVDLIEVCCETTFGNGLRVKCLNETGGREVPMFNNLSSQLAYIIALYRHQPLLIEKLIRLIDNEAEKVKSSIGHIGNGSRIVNCGSINNVNIGEQTHLESVKRLKNGSINSNVHDPVFIGAGVIMENFIVSSGCHISDMTLIENCFIGQACILGKHYSAYDSLFFANCEGFHGEACAIFAGPFTVSHHKSTLLIAGMFSFLNAGSGSNQSNHMYKLGPIHQGIVERGSKTTSDSYILWPSKIGAFTLVMGRHYQNADTSDLPFSYLIENNNSSVLAPAINLRSVGTIRDAQKWPKRDRRKDPNRLDKINFNLLSPYTIRKMVNGRDLLLRLLATNGTNEHYHINNIIIEGKALKRGIELYQTGINKFLGNSLISRINGKHYRNLEELHEQLKPTQKIGRGEWVDIAGLIAPKNGIKAIFQDVEKNKVNDIVGFCSRLDYLHTNYYEIEWAWSADLLEKEEKKSLAEITIIDLITIINRWKTSVIELDKMLYEDAKKEFSMSMLIGFGTDGDENDRKVDFEHVRGDFENNPVIKAINDHIIKKTELANNVIEKLKKIPH